ncbi:MAG TPA: hypothetical protein VIW26_03980, partial [Gemmatimonadales bacterium]
DMQLSCCVSYPRPAVSATLLLHLDSAADVLSSVAHTAVMAPMAIQLPTRRGELLAGVAVTGLSAVLLFVFAPSAARSEGAVPV